MALSLAVNFFSCLDFLYLRYLCLHCQLLCDHFQRENEVHFRALGFPGWQDTAPQVRHP